MSKNFRSIVSELSMKAACRAERVFISVFKTKPQEEEHAPVVTASSVYSQSSGFSSNAVNTANCEGVAPSLRAQQDDLWGKEEEQRRQDLAVRQQLHASGMSAKTSRLNRRTLRRTDSNHHIVHATTPLSTVAKLQQVAEHTVSDTSDGNKSPATWEQQTGVIRQHHVGPGQGIIRANESGSESSSIRRRGAVRLKNNPIHARPTHEEVARYARVQ